MSDVSSGINLIDLGLGAIMSTISGVAVFIIQRLVTKKRISDKDMLWRLNRAFDRPAFKGPFTWYSDAPNYREAVRQSIRAIATGYTSRGTEPEPGLGRVYLRNKLWRSKLEDVMNRLSRIISLLDEFYRYLAGTGKQLHDPDVEPKMKEVADKVDVERDKIIEELNEIWSAVGIDPLPIPTQVSRNYGE